jgi:PAS domain S-box-containing protein
MTIPLRLLLVEDAEDDALLLIRALRRGGYEPCWIRVETAETFVTALKTQEWELIIADYAMPQFSGLEALHLLRERGDDVPFIVVSGAIGEEVAVEAMKSGAHDYVMKGHLTRLVPAVTRELREAEIRRERRRAEEALRKSEERYRDLFENANDIIYTQDMEGNYTSVNKKGESLTGYYRDESVGLNMHQLVAPEYLPQSRENIARKLRGETTETVYELELLCRDGRRLPVEVSSRILYEDGQPVGIQGIARDISERKHLEEQLQQSQKMEAIGRLAGGIAHDFNNLLTAILGYSRIVLDKLPAQHSLRREVGEIAKAGDRAAQLTRQLLAFSRKQVLAMKVLDLNSVVAGIETMLHRVIGEDVHLVTHLPSGLWSVKADPGQIEQIIMNLAVNARDAMPRGGRLALETANVMLDATILGHDQELQPGPYVALRVRDTGTGMDKETLAHIFEPFFTTKDQGTGLGLSTVYGIVKQSGGHITVMSTPGEGTELTIYLPQIEAPAAPPQQEKPVRTPRMSHGGSETILLVEDEDAVRDLILLVLSRGGYTTLAAMNAEEALKCCEHYDKPIHLLITDLVMPGINGQELAERLVSLRPDMRVLYMSGYAADKALHSHGLAVDHTPFLQKPFTPRTFTQKVREVLDTVK